MRAIIINAYGPPAVLPQANNEAPQPGPDQLLIEVKAAGVNPIDWKIGKGNIRVVLDKVYPLEQAGEAHEYMEKCHARGKVVLTL
jgi:NADPH:quinone reductase-like Zn-dependent oxidoreductase